MSDDQHDQVLYAQFGTSSPCWRLSKDSNALELTPVTGDLPANAVIPLSPHQAAQIRRLAGITSHLILDVHLSDQPLRRAISCMDFRLPSRSCRRSTRWS
jgi:cyclic di-GMP phosphodiesterase Gmr